MDISCGGGHLRVDVHDSSPARPAGGGGCPADAETGRGLMLVATLSASWGACGTPTGTAVYFTLELASDAARAPEGAQTWGL